MSETVPCMTYTIKFYEPDTEFLWVGEILGRSGELVAQASGPNPLIVWDMLEHVIVSRLAAIAEAKV